MMKAALKYVENKVSIKRQWCKGCGICVDICESRVFMLDSLGKAVVVNAASCIGCEKCKNHCPDFAIAVDRNRDGGV